MEEIEDIFDNDNKSNLDYQFGEGYSKERITFKSLFASILSILNFEKGILFTIKQLIISPRVVIEEYLKRDRKKLINPIRFLVFSTAISAFLSISLITSNPEFNGVKVNLDDSFRQGVELAENNKLKEDSIQGKKIELILSHDDSVKIEDDKLKNEKMKEFAQLVQELSTKNSDKFTFILVLFFSFFTFLFFKRNGYNFTENLVINCYLSSMTSVFSIIFIIPAMITGQLIYMILATITTILFTIYFWVSVYNRKSIGGVFRSILAYFVSYFSFMIIIGIITAIYVAILLSN